MSKSKKNTKGLTVLARLILGFGILAGGSAPINPTGSPATAAARWDSGSPPWNALAQPGVPYCFGS